MEYFIQQLVNGITLGSIYGLIAIGYTMVYGIIGMINFAHGDIFMIGAFVALISFIIFGLTGVALPIILLLVLLIAMLFTACYGWTVEKLAYKPLRGSFRLAPLISALGMSIVLQNYVQVSQGARVKPMQPLFSGGLEFFKNSEFIVTVSYLQIFIVVLTIILMGIFTYLITKTDLGRAQRACEQDRTMTALLGINVDRTISITFIIGSSLASVAGMMFVLYYGVIDFYIGFLAGIKAFTAAVSSCRELANNFTILILLIVSTICPVAMACAFAVFVAFALIRGIKKRITKTNPANQKRTTNPIRQSIMPIIAMAAITDVRANKTVCMLSTTTSVSAIAA